MRTVDYSDVLCGSAALAGLQVSDLSPAEFALFRAAHDRRLQVAWECHRWPEICRYEQRSFRAPWDAAHAYAAGDEVLDIPTLTYLQALQASTGQPPTIANVVNQAYWAPCQAQYQADDYVAGTNYAVGAMVRNRADNAFYQMNALSPDRLLTVNNALTLPPSVATFVLGYTGLVNGRPAYADATTYHTCDWDGNQWRIYYFDSLHTLILHAHSLSDVATPDRAMDWVFDEGTFFGTSLALTLPPPAPPPSVNWGLLTPFNRYVGYEQTLADGTPLMPIGEFLCAWDRDPRVTTKLTQLPYTLSADGAQFMTLRHTLAYVWLLLRVRRPLLTGDAWGTTTVYASGQQMYFAPAAAPVVPASGSGGGIAISGSGGAVGVG
jgi:hypothetical protein